MSDKRRIMLTIEYDGTDYAGWQRQTNAVTVQQRVEEAIARLTGEEVSVVASGRTDSGVHALGQVCHFDTESTVPPEKFASALNGLLPPDIKVAESRLAPEGFHARYSAKRKTYVYNMYVSDRVRPLKSRYSAKIDVMPDVDAMRKAAAYLVGKHDFRCFLSSGSEVKDTVREIYSVSLVSSGEDIRFEITGSGFLYNMVRIVVGTLLKVGAGVIPPEKMEEIILSGDRSLAGATAPANGLTLLKAEY